jgi:hypothetical protein
MRDSIRDRRKRDRVELRCPVQILNSGELVKGETVNLSSEGVYWHCGVSFLPGETLQCSILISPPGLRGPTTNVFLRCDVKVVRVEETAGGFGTGCRIEHFLIQPGTEDAWPLWPEERSAAAAPTMSGT